MSDNANRAPGNESNTSKDRARAENSRKNSYEKPRVVYRAPLEAMAVVCAPSPPAKSNPGVCPSGPISS